MAREFKPDPIGAISSKKIKCPVCNCNFDRWFCPSCGLPKFNCKYLLEIGQKAIYSGMYRFCPEFKSFEDFQLCSKCYTTNPYGAKYCRNCGENMQLHAMDKNGHAWVDLGLSVLWSTETLWGFYRWMDTDNHFHCDCLKDYNQYKGNGKDTATYMWGNKWRMPTKEEFEELINKCKWEKFIEVETSKPALKITGPNGNHILFYMTGIASMTSGEISHEDEVLVLWTSTKDSQKESHAYAFRFSRQGTLKARNALSDLSKPLSVRFRQQHSYLPTDKWVMASFEKAEDMITVVPFRIGRPYAIRPVVDKKWQGHI